MAHSAWFIDVYYLDVHYLSMFMLAQCVWHCLIMSPNYMSTLIYYCFLLYRYFICSLEGRCTCDLYRY